MGLEPKTPGFLPRTELLEGTALAIPSPNPWIINRNQDLLWFQGSVVAGLALFILFVLLPDLDSSNYAVVHPAVLLLLAWGVIFDGTHVFSTYARTYFAKDPESRVGIPGRRGWILLLIGPAIALVDYLFFEPGPSLVGQAGILFRYFLLGAYIWAYYHLIRQHYGFLALYKRKEKAPANREDFLFLWVGSLYPLARYSLSDAYLSGGLPNLVSVYWLPQMTMALDILFGGYLVIAGSRFMIWLLSGRVQLAPKHLFLFIVVGFHVLVFALLDNLLTITATLTVFHNLQYHRIVWQYERGKGRFPMGNVSLYLGLGLLLGILWYTPRILGVAAAQTDLTRNLLLAFGWSIAFHHYLMDSRIWRVRRQPVVARTLDRGAH